VGSIYFTHNKKVEAELHSATEFSEKIINSIIDPLGVIDPKSYGSIAD
jgi:hypothetical protein